LIENNRFGENKRKLSHLNTHLPFPTAGAAAHGENKATACDALFKTYKACRKAEHVEVVRHRRENKKGLFWD